MIAPIETNDVIHVASSMVIFPLGNGVSSDVSRMFIGLDHPSSIPNVIINRFTVKTNPNLMGKNWLKFHRFDSF